MNKWKQESWNSRTIYWYLSKVSIDFLHNTRHSSYWIYRINIWMEILTRWLATAVVVARLCSAHPGWSKWFDYSFMCSLTRFSFLIFIKLFKWNCCYRIESVLLISCIVFTRYEMYSNSDLKYFAFCVNISGCSFHFSRYSVEKWNVTKPFELLMKLKTAAVLLNLLYPAVITE